METAEHTRNLAKRLRRRTNEPELRLWSCVRANRLDGVHVRRQHPLGPYVLDFFCARARLAIEIDGGMHDDNRRARDEARDAWLAMQDVTTLRLPASLVMNDMEAALSAIRRRLSARPKSSPVRGRGTMRSMVERETPAFIEGGLDEDA
ncbi:MAG: DUF559 domain-containing protein [Caulobacterales bacterium]|nr:DUF559 domain-containing protein [Caulobacterales bacterium]